MFTKVTEKIMKSTNYLTKLNCRMNKNRKKKKSPRKEKDLTTKTRAYSNVRDEAA